ncbi:MAG: GtrA family protein [Thiohalomonadales bacterium]
MNSFKQFFVYASMGAIGTFGHYVTLISLVQFWLIDPVYATTVGFIVGALINYTLNYRITFRSQKRHIETLPKFLVVAIIGSSTNGLIMFYALKYTNLHYMLIQVTATAIVLIMNFSLNKVWTFAVK